MVQVRIKRVYEDFSETDGYRVLVDKLWPRGMKKEWLKFIGNYCAEFPANSQIINIGTKNIITKQRF